MRTTLNIDDELLKDAKIAAVREGMTLTAYIERALRKECPSDLQRVDRGAGKIPMHSGKAPDDFDWTASYVTCSKNTKARLLILDVNVLLNASNSTASHHIAARSWLDDPGNGKEEVGIPAIVLSGFIRIVTGSAMKDAQLAVPMAFDVANAVLALPACRALVEGSGHWGHFRTLALRSQVSGKDIADAYLAAFAMENEATFVTFDRGCARFPGLRMFEPASSSQ